MVLNLFQGMLRSAFSASTDSGGMLIWKDPPKSSRIRFLSSGSHLRSSCDSCVVESPALNVSLKLPIQLDLSQTVLLVASPEGTRDFLTWNKVSGYLHVEYVVVHTIEYHYCMCTCIYSGCVGVCVYVNVYMYVCLPALQFSTALLSLESLCSETA